MTTQANLEHKKELAMMWDNIRKEYKDKLNPKETEARVREIFEQF